MTTRKMYAPPVLSGIEDSEDWLREIEVWQCVTEPEKKKQEAAICQSLEGKARKACKGTDVKALNADNGVYVLTNKLKEFYDARDTEQTTFRQTTSPIHLNTGLVSSGVSLTSWRQGVSLALVGHP